MAASLSVVEHMNALIFPLLSFVPRCCWFTRGQEIKNIHFNSPCCFFLITRQLLAEHSVLALVVLQKSAACCGTKSMHPNIKTSPKNNVNDVNRAAESSAQRFFSSYLTVSIDWVRN